MTANVARAVARALEADACFVYAYDRPADELVLQAVYGTHLDAAAPLPRMRPGEGLTGYAAREREPVAITADARSDPRFMGFDGLDEERFESLLAVPILDRSERLAGAMNVRTAQPREWHDDEVELLETIASQVAQAIENAKLYDRSRRRVTELEALARISEAVSQSLYESETLAEIVATARGAVHAEDLRARARRAGRPARRAARRRRRPRRRVADRARRPRARPTRRARWRCRWCGRRAPSARWSACGPAGSRRRSARCSARSPTRRRRPSSRAAA